MCLEETRTQGEKEFLRKEINKCKGLGQHSCFWKCQDAGRLEPTLQMVMASDGSREKQRQGQIMENLGVISSLDS